MTYQELEAALAAIPRFGSSAGPEQLGKYLDIMNHPERSLRVIHVAGTNGKGSVCAYLESILRNAGYTTGLFTSPHLVRLNERFRINHAAVSDEILFAAFAEVESVVKKGMARGLPAPGWFEIIFLMGLWIFSQSPPDYCIMETGLGGRLDATVLLEPLICVITSISLDHTSLLGNTIEEIAAEKAGILKRGAYALALDEGNGAFEVLLSESRRKNIHLERVACQDVTILKKSKNKIDFSINTSYYRYEMLEIKTWADYQIYNAALAVCALRILLPDIKEEVIRQGLLTMTWPGRMEEIRPGVFVDGAHNPGAIDRICQLIRPARQGQSPAEQDPSGLIYGRSLTGPEEKRREQDSNWLLLFAVCSDKDYTDMIRRLAAVPWRRVYITRADSSRGARMESVRTCFSEFCNQEPVCLEHVEDAYRRALSDKAGDEYLLCLGSLYLAGEILKLEERDLS